MEPVKKKCLGMMKFLPSDAEVLSRVETPPRPVPKPARDAAQPYRAVYFHSLYDGRKKP